MINVTLRNGAVLLFHEWEQVNTVGWISDDGEYWSAEKPCRADELAKLVEKQGDCYIIARIDENDGAVTEQNWLSPVASVRKFEPLAFA